jgi:hypothetical protein
MWGSLLGCGGLLARLRGYEKTGAGGLSKRPPQAEGLPPGLPHIPKLTEYAHHPVPEPLPVPMVLEPKAQEMLC